MFWIRCLRLFTAYYYVYIRIRNLGTGSGVLAVAALCVQMDMALYELREFTWRCLSSHLHALVETTRIFISASVKDLGAGLLFKIWHPVAISPFSTFSGLLENFQVEDSHLLNHQKPPALLWMSFIQGYWPSLTLFRLGSNEPTIQGGVVALSRLCK